MGTGEVGAYTSRLILIGPMGAGKTAIGRQLARMLEWDWVDTDQEIERLTGADISFIFEKEGETGFRKRESRVIRSLLQRDKIVIATGGGIVVDPDNRRLLSAAGIVVYLETTPSTQFERTRRRKDRPLLEVKDRQKRLQQLFEQREPIYREMADLVVMTDGRKVREVAQYIRRHLKTLN